MEAVAARQLTNEPEFKALLTAVIPQLRAFARSLSGNRDLADDLVQETMIKAWAARDRYERGTNFRAWTYTILRNHFFSLVRRRRFSGDWNDLMAERVLAAPASQDATVECRDMLRALQQLPLGQREALILVGAGGLAYEDVAEITGVAVGTVKSRVSRGREALHDLVSNGQLRDARATTAGEGDIVVDMIAYLDSIRRRHTERQARDCGQQIAA